MRLLVLYGSQTGTAQDVAEQIWRESRQWGFQGPVLSLEDYDIQQLVEERLVVFVVATTGDGMEPDNMKQAWRFLLKRSLPSHSLSGLQFACLGLGDSSYSKFNYAAKKLHKRLLNLGAKSICPLGLCDDQHDYGHLGTSLAWTAELWNTLSNTLAVHKQKEPMIVKRWNVRVIEQSPPLDEDRLQWTQRQEAHVFKLAENTRTTAADHFQDVRLLRLERSTEAISWQPGDVLEVQPQNSCELVKDFFDLLKEHQLQFDASTVVEVSSAHEDLPLSLAYSKPLSLQQAAKYIWDLSARPRQRLLEVLAQNCEDEMEREKLLEFCSAEGLEDLISYVNRPRRMLLELLQDFRHAMAKLTLSQLFEMMPLIQTRSFSIASDQSAKTLDLLVAVVNYKTIMHTPRLGLCSNWLKDLEVGVELRAAIKPGTMTWPKEVQTPLIMIGPGTGIAPFRSIIQNRLHLQQLGQNVGPLVVFFGCRNRSKDYHFVEDFTAWQDNNCVEVHVAFSRDQENKVYVQHLIRQHGAHLAKLIREQNAYIYVAGSSNNMPKAVREAFIEALDNDASYIDQLIKQRRYQEETWA
ncbi:PREDICTED: NADPH-dependent diflavin oxidoreductase 1 [Drosophila arizonae]|uniref:NADPH-dependent diflavin oxidoreductase 1 n=1 Tax=Drosophila arizonae TaxID=7263 RepID=A0ABM1P279_DROAR|nr:PREDICTED: NADPH-dependent diflavin oxidoreductase 1 [Drosophila arizonae]XP_017861315.1 PREDICTED: NADPH-dependent diflavin oxidoreductase 1 [Drosophila arizonae]